MKLVKKQLIYFNESWYKNYEPGKISIITPVYSEKQKSLKEIIQKIFFEYKDINYEYIVVNNGIQSDVFNDPFFNETNTRILHSKKNLGASWGRNYGALNSTGEYLVFLDSDVIRLEPECIHSMRKILSKNKDIGCIGGQVIEYKNNEQTLHMGTFADHDYANRKDLYTLIDDIYCNTSCIMVPRIVFKKVNGFTDFIEYMHDDVDFGFKIKSIGLRNIVDKRCVCFHPKVPLTMPYKNLLMMIKNSMIFNFINFPLQNFFKKIQNTFLKKNDYRHPLDNYSGKTINNLNIEKLLLEKVKFLFCLIHASFIFFVNIISLIKLRDERLKLLKKISVTSVE